MTDGDHGCHLCGNDNIGEGLVLRNEHTYTGFDRLILGWDCWRMIRAVIKDNILAILGEIGGHVGGQVKELKGWLHPDLRESKKATATK